MATKTSVKAGSNGMVVVWAKSLKAGDRVKVKGQLKTVTANAKYVGAGDVMYALNGEAIVAGQYRVYACYRGV